METKIQKNNSSKNEKNPYFTRSQSKGKKKVSLKRIGFERVKIKRCNFNITKDYLKEMNQNSSWLMKDGKKMYKDSNGQTGYK